MIQIKNNCHEPYMTKEQFYALPCNMRQGENKKSTRKKYKKPNPLAKRIICTCGRPLYWHKDKKTGEELFYCSYCRAHKENGKELKAPAASVYKKVIDAMEREHRIGGYRRWHEKVERICPNRNRQWFQCSSRNWMKKRYQPQSMDGFRWKMMKITKAWKRRLHWCRILLTVAVN